MPMFIAAFAGWRLEGVWCSWWCWWCWILVTRMGIMMANGVGGWPGPAAWAALRCNDELFLQPHCSHGPTAKHGNMCSQCGGVPLHAAGGHQRICSGPPYIQACVKAKRLLLTNRLLLYLDFGVLRASISLLSLC